MPLVHGHRTRIRRGIAAISLAALVITAIGCGEDDARTDGLGGAPTSGDPGPIHVHGLGVNPADGALFIATHTGLFRAPEDTPDAERVAGRYQDTMGFTVTGPDRFLGSGHPDSRENLPPFLGLIRSDDAGRTWEPVSLLGEADFHVLESSGDLVYGYGSDWKTRKQRLLVSADAGENWKEQPLPEEASDQLTEESLRSIAIDPENPSAILASGQQALWSSSDQGRHWKFLAAESGLLAWPQSDAVFLLTDAGEVLRSDDQGRSFTPVGSVGGEPAAFEASGGDLLAALHDGTIKLSTDGGVTWSVRSTP